ASAAEDWAWARPGEATARATTRRWIGRTDHLRSGKRSAGFAAGLAGACTTGGLEGGVGVGGGGGDSCERPVAVWGAGGAGAASGRSTTVAGLAGASGATPVAIGAAGAAA